MRRIIQQLDNVTPRQGVIIVLIAVAVFALLMVDQVRSLILLPFLYVIWIARIVYESLPQIFWWMVALFILTIIASRSLIRKRSPKFEAGTGKRPRASRVDAWINIMENASKGGYFKWYQAYEISQLLIKVVSSQEDLENDLQNGGLVRYQDQLPPEILEYLEVGLDAQKSFNYTEPGLRIFSRQAGPQLKQEPDRLIEFMEEHLDIEDEAEEVTDGHEH